MEIYTCTHTYIYLPLGYNPLLLYFLIQIIPVNMIVNYANERGNKQVSKSLTVCQAHVFRTKCKKYRTKNIESKVSRRRDDQAGLPG